VYEKFPRLDKNWTPIERKVVEIQIRNNPFHTITKNQFPIQLVISHIIHFSQGLTLAHLTFESNGLTKYGLTYTSLFKVCFKKHLYLLSPLLSKNFQIYHVIQEEML
jgi:hypothetical protein